MAIEVAVGQLVTLRSSQGQIQRILVKDLGEMVLICRAEEYAAAKQEGREPITMAFPRQDLIASGKAS